MIGKLPDAPTKDIHPRQANGIKSFLQDRACRGSKTPVAIGNIVSSSEHLDTNAMIRYVCFGLVICGELTRSD